MEDEGAAYHGMKQPAEGQQSDDCDTGCRKKRLPKRDIRTLNYAFGEPRLDQAAKETQEWLDSLSIAEEEENNPTRKIFPPGPKYRTGSANQSPQMFDRLHRCEESQEPYDPPKNRIQSAERNQSSEIHAGLHEEDNCNRHLNVWKGRRSAAGNNSSSVYAILHPQAELGSTHTPSTAKVGHL